MLCCLFLGNLASHVETTQGDFCGVDVQLHACARVTWFQRHIRELEARVDFEMEENEALADWRGICHRYMFLEHSEIIDNNRHVESRI